jgi:hypothetical protein
VRIGLWEIPRSVASTRVERNSLPRTYAKYPLRLFRSSQLTMLLKIIMVMSQMRQMDIVRNHFLYQVN